MLLSPVSSLIKSKSLTIRFNLSIALLAILMFLLTDLSSSAPSSNVKI